MSPKWIMFIAGIFLCGNLFCLMLDGSWLGAEDASVMSDLTGAQVQEAGGVWGVISATGSFLTGLLRSCSGTSHSSVDSSKLSSGYFPF